MLRDPSGFTVMTLASASVRVKTNFSGLCSGIIRSGLDLIYWKPAFLTRIPSRKWRAVLKSHALQNLRDYRSIRNRAKRLECGAFTVAFHIPDFFLCRAPVAGYVGRANILG